MNALARCRISTTLHRIVEACGLELRLEIAEPDVQRVAAERMALERTVEERLRENTRQVELIHALRQGGSAIPW